MNQTSVPFSTEDRQWDARFNVQDDDYCASIVESIMLESTSGKFKYVLVSGVEVGTRPYQTDYKCKHIHVAAIFNNRASKASILKNWGIVEGNGYYLVPRKRDLPYSGWREHHIKEFSKVDPKSLILFESGELPRDKNVAARVDRAPIEKKRKLDEILIDMRTMLADGKDEEVFLKYPRNSILYAPRLKAMIHQKADFFGDNSNPHIWLYGFSGAGKTSIMKFLYPDTYKKDLQNRFFDLYDPKQHTHIMLEDLDHDCIDRLGWQFIKTICDPQGFPIDQKYKTPQLTRSTILVTSNFSIHELIGTDTKGIEVQKTSLLRRFWHVRVDKFLPIIGIKMIEKYERTRLKSEGNDDISKIFMTWDYVTDSPMGLPLKTPAEYQAILKEAFYKL